MGARLSGRSPSVSRTAGRASTRYLSCGWGRPEAERGAGVPGRRAGVPITPVGIFHPPPSWRARDPPAHLVPSKTDESPGDGWAPGRDRLMDLRGGPPVQVAPLRGTGRKEGCVLQPPTPLPRLSSASGGKAARPPPEGCCPCRPCPLPTGLQVPLSAHTPRTHTCPLAPPRSRQGLPKTRSNPLVECWTPTSHAEPGPAKAGSFFSHSSSSHHRKTRATSLGPWGLVGRLGPMPRVSGASSSAVIPRTIPTPTPPAAGIS